MHILVILAFVALGIFSYAHDTYAQLACNDPHCYALKQHRQNFVDGLKYDLPVPDLWIDRHACNDIAVSTGWLVSASNREWVEAGVTKGYLENLGGTATCVTQLSMYYAYNTKLTDNRYKYQEILVPNGRVDPGDDVSVQINRAELQPSSIQVYVTTPDRSNLFPVAQISMDSANVYYADFGIEGTVSASDEYSSIPMSKFTDMQIRQGNSWTNLPGSSTLYVPDDDEGYLGQKCLGNSFIAGTVTELDCNNIATRNQIPSVSTQLINLSTNSPYAISLDGKDTDRDYLTYNLVELPTNGFLNYNNLGQKIPNTDGDSSQLIYTPASSTPESDTIRYSVTDGRMGHTREGLISIIGPASESGLPDRIDDFAYSLSGTTIHFTWSHPFDGGSEITYYEVQRSYDAVTWSLHERYSETATSFDYTRHEGYDRYFRVFANNAHGESAASNILHVHIPDTTPPDVTIQNPNAGVTLLTSDVFVSGNVYESQSSGIEDIKIRIDGIASNDPVTTSIISENTNVNFESTLTGLSNGRHTITAHADNGDGYTASDSIVIIVAVPESDTLNSFSDNFEETMSNWIVTTQDDEYWSIRNSPIVPVLGLPSENKVAGTEDCDNTCTMTMIDSVDLTQMDSPKLSFYRFVATSADASQNEGIVLYISENNGNTWSTLDRFTADESDDDGTWHKEEYDLSHYSASAQFKLKFEAISSSNSEDTELDDVLIYDASADATDATSPRIDSISRLEPLDESTDSSALKFRVTFDEPVTGVDQSDFETGGTAASSVTGFVANSAVQYDVDVSVTTGGTVSLNLISLGHGIADTDFVPNALTDTAPKSITQTYIVALDTTVPGVPTDVTATLVSTLRIAPYWPPPSDESSIFLARVVLDWTPPSHEGDSPITGYLIERSIDDKEFVTIASDTAFRYSLYVDIVRDSTAVSYRVSAINDVGVSLPSEASEQTSTLPKNKSPHIQLIDGNREVDAQTLLSFSVYAIDRDRDPLTYSLGSNAPQGAEIGRTTGEFTWTPTQSQVGTHTFDAIVSDGKDTDSKTITVIVNDA